MKKIWLVSGGMIPKDWAETFASFLDYDPDEVVILSNTEVNIEGNWSKFLDFIQPWLKERNKIAYLVTPHLENVWVRPNILTEKSYSMVESAWPLFMDRVFEKFSYNRIYSAYMYRPDEARGRLIDTIISNGILEDGYVTYHNTDVMVYQGFNYYKKDPIVIKEEIYTKDSGEQFVFPPFYRNSFIDVTPESSFLPNQFFLTEKTIRAICHEKPFMTIGPKGFHKEYLSGYFGLDLYHEIIDYSFDDRESLQDRIDGVVVNIKNFIDNKSKLDDMYQSVKQKLINNKKKIEEIYNDPNRIVPNCLRPLLNKNYDYQIDGRWQVSMMDLIKKYRSSNG